MSSKSTRSQQIVMNSDGAANVAIVVKNILFGDECLKNVVTCVCI
jgi:hypothetical protein